MLEEWERRPTWHNFEQIANLRRKREKFSRVCFEGERDRAFIDNGFTD